MSDTVKSVECFALTIPRDTPYLGSPRDGEGANARGYIVRKGNKTVYPTFDRSVLVRIETVGGVVGWGETYGLVSPGAVGEIIGDLLADFTIGRDPTDPSAIYDDLYDLMRVRGYIGGFFVDALAAIDIALWDIAGRIAKKTLADLLGGRVHDKIPAYVSGLPEKTLEDRVSLAQAWQAKGFNAFKFALPVADGGAVAETRALREGLGPDARIAADMHWRETADEALDIIRGMAPHGLWFAEAPVRTEDFAGLARVCRDSKVPIAVGEEWRTPYDFLNRIDRCDIAILQPEMGHKGVTNFTRIAQLGKERGLPVIPHATIGAGIFLAASIQASSALPNVPMHEYQHSVFEPNRHLLKGNMSCRAGAYTPPSGIGLGVGPSDEALGLLEPLKPTG